MRRAIVVFILLLASNAALAEVPIHRPVFCPQIYEPVCGFLDGKQLTFSNLCKADAAGAKFLHQGACSTGQCEQIYRPVCAINPATGKETTYGNACLAEKAGESVVHDGACGARTMCNMIYKPVCARNPKTGQKQTYPNSCFANASGADVLYPGQCRITP